MSMLSRCKRWYELEETAAVVIFVQQIMVAGEKAGTALRGALTRLLKPSEQNANAMEKLGFLKKNS